MDGNFKVCHNANFTVMEQYGFFSFSIGVFRNKPHKAVGNGLVMKKKNMWKEIWHEVYILWNLQVSTAFM